MTKKYSRKKKAWSAPTGRRTDDLLNSDSNFQPTTHFEDRNVDM